MIKFVLLVALFAFALCQKEIQFKMCGTNTVIKQKKMYHTPDVLKPGMEFLVTTEGENIGGPLSNGITTTRTTYMGIEVQVTRHSICDSMGGCPVKTGPTISKSKTNLPRHAPSGEYKCSTKTYDSDGKELTCVEWSFNVTR